MIVSYEKCINRNFKLYIIYKQNLNLVRKSFEKLSKLD